MIGIVTLSLLEESSVLKAVGCVGTGHDPERLLSLHEFGRACLVYNKNYF